MMDLNEKCRSLTEMHFFSGLSEEVLHQLADLAQPRRYGAGEFLFHEGVCSGELFLLRQGKVQLQMCVPGHGSIPILTLGPGQLVGWSAILGAGDMTTSAVALELTTTLVFPAEKLKKIFEQDFQFGFRFMERLADALARRLVATRLQLLDLFANESPPISMNEDRHG